MGISAAIARFAGLLAERPVAIEQTSGTVTTKNETACEYRWWNPASSVRAVTIATFSSTQSAPLMANRINSPAVRPNHSRGPRLDHEDCGVVVAHGRGCQAIGHQRQQVDDQVDGREQQRSPAEDFLADEQREHG
jgi:hypothetical protein